MAGASIPRRITGYRNEALDDVRHFRRNNAGNISLRWARTERAHFNVGAGGNFCASANYDPHRAGSFTNQHLGPSGYAGPDGPRGNGPRSDTSGTGSYPGADAHAGPDGPGNPHTACASNTYRGANANTDANTDAYSQTYTNTDAPASFFAPRQQPSLGAGLR